MSVDELDLVRALGSGIGTADGATRRRARARLDAVVSTETLALRRALPSELNAPRRRRWAVFVPAAAALAVLLLLLQAVLPTESGGPTAAEALDRLADVAATRPPIVLGPGEFLYERSRGLVLHEGEDLVTDRIWRATVPTDRELWVASDGSGRVLAVSGDPVLLTPEDQRAWEAEGSPAFVRGGAVRDETYGPGELPFVDLGDLPADPAVLRDMIVAREILPGPAGHAENLRIVGDLLRETVGPPEVRAGLFRAAALLPGVELDADAEDHAGRAGVAVSAVDADASVTLIFDPATAELLEVQDEAAGVQTWTTVMASGVTDRPDARP